jgi:hypothetical protein
MTDRETLIQLRRNAVEAIDRAIEALHAMQPQEADYPDLWVFDRVQIRHHNRRVTLENVARAIEEEANYLGLQSVADKVKREHGLET